MTLKQVIDAMHPEKFETKADGTVVVDPTSLEQVGSRLVAVRQQMSELKKEEEKLRKLILVHPKSVVGFSNSYVKIGGADILNTEDPLLEKTLRECGRWEDALDIKISSTKVRKIAAEVPAVNAVLKFNQERRVKQAGDSDE